MKKGISLIVLVITIIVMIIIAGAIIISLSQTNIISQANNAVTSSNLANARSIVSLKFSTDMANAEGPLAGVVLQDYAGELKDALTDANMEATSLKDYVLTINFKDSTSTSYTATYTFNEVGDLSSPSFNPEGTPDTGSVTITGVNLSAASASAT